ncbi:DUF1285 domain-containing protein [Ancylobacter polymorphus]|uniref:DUF1285 domain-containing protein n=1 Tax=Ancylobacter polymorphus TaxID=223390 RepID=A0A9E6ZSY9_9HYPH|nr:DUF1285 domain-containing protein [Ancylobacter polymorphus]UOK69582.1 DUF1285 domain-containing protein [Ancylobacter polymorphus]
MNSETSARIDDLVRALGNSPAQALPPVERWNPPDCGEIDIVIDREGVWHHEGRPIRRPALVRLFASVLRREGERYVLVTPVEKLGIRVEDAPFLAVAMAVEPEGAGEGAPRLIFRTNLDDVVACDRDHKLRVDIRADGEPRPYVYIRRGLWARLTRAVFLDLAERAEERVMDGRRVFGVASGGAFFALAPAEELDEEG